MADFHIPSVILLGVPVSTLTLEENIAQIQKLLENYPKDLRPCYIGTLNMSVINSAFKWHSSEPQRPELINTLREASLFTVNSKALKALTTLLGTPVKENISEIDLIHGLAKSVHAKKQSLYLLGGDERTLKLCKLYLEDEFTDLKICGASNAPIDVEGDHLEGSYERDSLLLERIHNAHPDILLINLGNPKQEIWYARVRDKLHVPVSIGINGSLDSLAGLSPCFPSLEQMGWSLKNFFSFLFFSVPLVIYQALCHLIYTLFYQQKNGAIKVRDSLLFISPNKTIAVLPLPAVLNERVSEEVDTYIDDLFGQETLVLDFSQVQWIDPYGLELLLKFWRRAAQERKRVFALQLKGDMCTLLKLSKCWDVVKDDVCNSPREILERLGPESNDHFFDAVQQEFHFVIVSFFGSLNNLLNPESYLKKLLPTIQHKHCILDFTYCTNIDNRGIAFLLKLKKDPEIHLVSLKLTGLSPFLERELRLAKVYDEFNFLSNLDTALA